MNEASALVDVAQEARWLRWRIADVPILEGWRDQTADGALKVGHGAPVRVVTLDPRPGRADQATRRAILESGARVALSLNPADERAFGERAQAIREATPDVVVIPLMERSSVERVSLLVEALRFGCGAQRPRPRVFVASSDPQAIARASALISPFGVEVVPDPRTDEGRAHLVRRLRSSRHEGGVLRDEALEAIARAIARAQSAPALVIDVSGASTSLVRADPSGDLHAVHVRPLGIGRGADRVVALAGLERVRRWIPWTVDSPTLLERVFNRARWPDAQATDRETAALEMALAHEAIAHALGDAAGVGIADRIRSARAVLLTGRLATLPGAAHAALVAIDGLGPLEPASIGRDDSDVLVAVAGAALATATTDALAPAIAERAVPLAAVVPLAGRRRSAVRILSGTEVRDEKVDPGSFFLVPVRGDVDIAAPGVSAARLDAGSVGVIVDARKRPLALPLRDAERVPTVAGWYGAVGAMPA